MKIGICGNENEIKNALINDCGLLCVSKLINGYDPEELLLDVEEGFFDCDILFINVTFDEFLHVDFNGVELVKKINLTSPRCQIIYVSDKSDYIDEIYDTRHVYLMSKELIKEKIKKAYDKAVNGLKSTIDKDVIEIICDGGRNYIQRDSILYIERDGRRVQVVTSNHKYICYESIKHIRERLDDRMAQVYGGGIVHLGYITYLGKGVAELSYEGIEKTFPVGRTFFSRARDAYYNYWKKDSD